MHAYFQGLSRRYQGWRVTIDFISRNFGNQQLADGRPLLGFSVETEGSEAGDILIDAYGACPGQPHEKDWTIWVGNRKDEPMGQRK